MRVAVMTAGPRGDVAPYTGLGHGLMRAGHEVTLVSHACFAPLAASAGLGFHAVPVDPRAELASARGRVMQRSGTDVGKPAPLVGMARAVVGRMSHDLLQAAQASDVVLVSSSLGPLGHTIAQGLGLPSMGVFLQPLAPTREFPPPVTGTRSWGATGNRLAGRAVNAAVDRMFVDAARGRRSRLGLPAAGSHADRRTRERGWPVFVGLGSATVPEPERLSRAVVRALRTTGLRGVIQRGWGGLHADGDDVPGAVRTHPGRGRGRTGRLRSGPARPDLTIG
ncbi:glycosyltransferase [Streptomyces zaomyceticus]|uniref:glycosyltransferase n=2 Tax=Streptomyces zaomyceticus TaxID=68286 RepID=UPI00378C1D66